MEIAQDVVRVLRRYFGRGLHSLCPCRRRDQKQRNHTKARRTPNAEIHTVVSRAPHSTNGSAMWLQRLLKKALAFVAASRRGHFSRVARPFGIAFLPLQELLDALETHYSLCLLRRN